MKKSSLPTRKWWAAQITAAVGLALMLLTGDSTVTDPEKVAIGTWLVQAATAYLVPNDSTPGGVPATTRRRKRHDAGQGLIGVIVVLLVAALVYWLCVALGLPWVVAVIAAILVLIAGLGSAGRF